MRSHLDKGARHLRGRRDHLLAVIEDQQGATVSEMRAHRLQ